MRDELRAVHELGQRFVNAGEELLVLMEEAVAERPANLSDAQHEAIQRLGRAAAEGAPLEDALEGSARSRLITGCAPHVRCQVRGATPWPWSGPGGQ